MPVRSTTINLYSIYHSTPSEFLLTVLPWLSPKHERAANVWLPHALKCAAVERTKLPTMLPSPPSTTFSPPDNFWLTSWTHRVTATGDRTSTLDCVLSCTTHQLGTYPIFLYTLLPETSVSPSYIAPRMDQLAEKLASLVPRERVYSVFGSEALARYFVSAWSARTRSVPEPSPFYAAKLTYCTRDSLTPPRNTLPKGHYLGLAKPIDARNAAYLCQWFAEESIYFPLDYAQALQEAQELIRQQQLWVYYIDIPGQRTPALASIVACTRSSDSIATITKVYTNPSCRGQGCAERLVRRACEFWLYEVSKSAVMLYVAHDNPAASTVYHRVGFAGLQPNAPRIEDVEDWIEIGFQDTNRGHW